MIKKLKYQLDQFKRPFPDVGSLAYGLAGLRFNLSSKKIKFISVKENESEYKNVDFDVPTYVRRNIVISSPTSPLHGSERNDNGSGGSGTSSVE